MMMMLFSLFFLHSLFTIHEYLIMGSNSRLMCKNDKNEIREKGVKVKISLFFLLSLSPKKILKKVSFFCVVGFYY